MSIVLIIGVVTALGAAALVAFGLSEYLRQRNVFARRLAATPAQFEARREPTVRPQLSLEDNVLKRFEDMVTPKSPDALLLIRKRLISAGYRRPSAVRLYYALKAGLGLGFVVLVSLIVPVLMSDFSVPVIGLVIIGVALLGYCLPNLWVSRQMQRRQEAAELGFPDMLDMLLVCIGAGNGLDQAMLRVAHEFVKINPTLAEELDILNDELRAGKARVAVMRDFSERLAVDDIANFTTVLKQSDEFGVSVADTLRVYAGEMRNKRLMRAEEKANLMPVKIALGSILFTVPPTMLVMAGPSLIMMIRSLNGMGG
jgi:tight adherence protein C